MPGATPGCSSMGVTSPPAKPGVMPTTSPDVNAPVGNPGVVAPARAIMIRLSGVLLITHNTSDCKKMVGKCGQAQTTAEMRES